MVIPGCTLACEVRQRVLQKPPGASPDCQGRLPRGLWVLRILGETKFVCGVSHTTFISGGNSAKRVPRKNITRYVYDREMCKAGKVQFGGLWYFV